MLIGYARVSTQEQNLELQINALQAAGCKKIFTEKASGAQRDRPELKAALEYMRANEDDTLVVWKLDRLARSLRQLIDTIEELEKKGIGFKSLTENIDTTTSGGRLVFHIFGALAEFERILIKERTMAGLKAAKAMGKKGGRPQALEAEDLRDAKALLRNKKITVKEVAKRLKVDPSTLYRYLPGGRSSVQEDSTSIE
ncbi:MAG: recombinase family protein [Rickettsiaceae bacterium]|jgi:DNA invertase Pin-like site-specific DNA recombinase|nr:recombinase family protein [Rickettsiaceae bacterium]MCP5463356.1 recombinase family protein [bacterium]